MTEMPDSRSTSRTDRARARLDPAALPLADAARLLSAAGGQRVTVEILEADVAAGAPTNPNGTIDLVRYAAWLVAKHQAKTP